MIITHHNAVFVVDVVMGTHAKCTVQGYPQRLGSHWHPELGETRVVFGHFPLGHLLGELSLPRTKVKTKLPAGLLQEEE